MITLLPHIKPHGRLCTHRRRYWMSCEDYEGLRSEADGRCQICSRSEADELYGVLCIDHDPSLGLWAVRGLLCNRCNSALHQPALAGPPRDRYLASPWHKRRTAS